MTEFVPVLFGVKAGAELPAGTLAAASEDGSPAVHHTSPASLVAPLWFRSDNWFRGTAAFLTNTQASGLTHLVFAG